MLHATIGSWYGDLAAISCVIALLIWIRLRNGQWPIAAKGQGTEHVIARMIDQRQSVDGRLKHEPKGKFWIVGNLWSSPEGRLLSAIRNALWLQDAGKSPAEAWAKVVPASRTQILLAANSGEARQIGIRGILAECDPDYLPLGERLVDRVADIAERCVVSELHKVNAAPQWPPFGWMDPAISKEEFVKAALPDELLERGFDLRTQQLNDIATRYVAGDEIRAFESPAEMWRARLGRAGYVLLRRGRPIARAVTMMN